MDFHPGEPVFRAAVFLNNSCCRLNQYSLEPEEGVGSCCRSILAKLIRGKFIGLFFGESILSTQFDTCRKSGILAACGYEISE
ncbi:hypothetical protein S1OALGB6SA_2300 [Olavius algarvensis spirochete endosymbiont]|nr:hypothetical protein S1OALGB6SA_2300 [Olavius algarvensis spirochete endosymbiont]